MVSMMAPEQEVWLSQDRMLTVDDMEDITDDPDDDLRYELDDGMLIVSPAPANRHQLAVTQLTVLLANACPKGLVVLAGVGVNINKFQHRVPDVAVVRSDGFGTTFQERPPELVVEVASPRTRLYDMNRKKDVYQSFGVPAYWIVDPDAQRPVLTVFELAGSEYAEIARVTGDEPFEARIPFAVTIVPRDLVRLT